MKSRHLSQRLLTLYLWHEITNSVSDIDSNGKTEDKMTALKLAASRDGHMNRGMQRLHMSRSRQTDSCAMRLSPKRLIHLAAPAAN